MTIKNTIKRHKVRTAIVGVAATLAMAGGVFAALTFSKTVLTTSATRGDFAVTASQNNCDDAATEPDPTIDGLLTYHIAACDMALAAGGYAVTLSNSYGGYSPTAYWSAHKAGGVPMKVGGLRLTAADGIAPYTGPITADMVQGCGVSVPEAQGALQVRVNFNDPGTGVVVSPFLVHVDYVPQSSTAPLAC